MCQGLHECQFAVTDFLNYVAMILPYIYPYEPIQFWIFNIKLNVIFEGYQRKLCLHKSMIEGRCDFWLQYYLGSGYFLN